MNKKDALEKNIAQLRSVNEDKNFLKDGDPLWNDQLERINKTIDDIQDDIRSDNKKEQARQIALNAIQTKSAKRFDMVERKAFGNYLRKGIQSDGSIDRELGTKIQVSSSRGDFGYNATYSVADSIYNYLQSYSIMRQLSSSILISRDSLDMPVVQGDIACQWEDGSTLTSNAPMVMNSIKTFELTAQPKVTQKMIDDTVIDLESWLVEKLSALFLVAEDAAFLKGDGTKQPKGILSYSDTGAGSIKRIKSAGKTSFTEDELLQLYYSLNDYYSNNAVFIMNKSVMQMIRTFKDKTSGQYYWMPGLLSGKADTLLGCPVHTSESMPNAAASADVVLYGDMRKAYQIVDRSEITIQRDPYSSKPFVIFYATKRVGGDVIDNSAVAMLRMSA